MHIDWSVTEVYNTTMSAATGVALLMMVCFVELLRRGRQVSLEGWSIGFAVPGFILTVLGMHMTMTWPLSKIGFPFDDIIFGEPSLAFGVLLLAAAILIWRKSNMLRSEGGGQDAKKQTEAVRTQLASMLYPLSFFAAAMGLALIAIACAGIRYQLFAAPPQEPISGAFADYPMLEATFISGLYALTGIGAILLPFSFWNKNPTLIKWIEFCWVVTGVIFTLFGAMNFFTHIGLIINTMK